MSATTPASRSKSPVDIGLALMVLASIFVITMPEDWLRTSFTLEPSNYSAELVGDAYIGGNSTASWVDEDTQHWQCELGSAAGEPFCSMQIDVTNADDVGIDLHRFDQMTVWADYQGDATHVRLYLRNRHPNYYDPANSITTKYNTIEVPVKELATGLTIELDDFYVAGWWLIAGNLPLSYANPEFNEVSIVEVQTGSRVRTGTHKIQLKKVVWSGRILEQSVLYQAVIIAWSVVIICILGYRLLLSQRELNRQRETHEELMAVNAALNLETRHYEDLAKTDALTGLYNRVGIRDVLHEGLVEWRDAGVPFSFVMIDLDHFKTFNDTHGHDVGDRVLRDTAKLMQAHVRRTDVLARWGGEEFVLACPDTTLDQAVQAAENLREALATKLSYNGSPVTASFGVATMDQPSLERLFKKADIALYRAKKLGRNRVCSERSS
jgi:diguanylate cyclase (GGDEF)-like protein